LNVTHFPDGPLTAKKIVERHQPPPKKPSKVERRNANYRAQLGNPPKP
jgi:hypothetical protein